MTQKQADNVLRKLGIPGRMVAVAIIAGVLGGTQQQAAGAQVVNQDQGRYQNQLLELSHILGKLHHLRGNCVSGEHQLWRDNMMELVRLENPPPSRKNQMVADFNDAYETARRQYPTCNRMASREAADLASDGAVLSDALASNVAR